jgi:hypothetical protein
MQVFLFPAMSAKMLGIITTVRFKINFLAKTAIIAGLSAVSSGGWSQTQEVVAPVPKTEAVIEDHSYLPPSMRNRYLPPNAASAASPRKAARRAQRHVKRERRYAQASGWGLFDDQR